LLSNVEHPSTTRAPLLEELRYEDEAGRVETDPANVASLRRLINEDRWLVWSAHLDDLTVDRQQFAINVFPPERREFRSSGRRDRREAHGHSSSQVHGERRLDEPAHLVG
jgi:hypothetical protein